MNRNMVKRTATCSGRPEMLGNLEMMSVISWDRGSMVVVDAGLRRDETEGYAGGTVLGELLDRAASRLRSWRKLRRTASSGQVGAQFLGSMVYTGCVLS